MFETPWMALKADTHRIYGSYNLNNFIRGFLKNRNFRLITSIRLCQISANSVGIMKLGLPIFRIMHRVFSHSAGIDLSWKTRIGGGLALTHGWGAVISPAAVIGRNVTLFHGVTLGRRDRIEKNGERLHGVPIIEDDVWVGPHAIIVGGVTVGRGSRIAGGAFVTDSVPPYSTVCGNPSSIVRRDSVSDVMNSAHIYH